MSWVSLLIEEHLSEEIESGRFVVAERLKGKPIPDIDRHKEEGWWAEEFVRRERSRDRQTTYSAKIRRARAGFWRASTETELVELVRRANEMVVHANLNLIEAHRLDRFDVDDVVDRWRRLRR